MVLDYKRVFLIDLQEVIIVINLLLVLVSFEVVQAALTFCEPVLRSQEKHCPFYLHRNLLITVIWYLIKTLDLLESTKLRIVVFDGDFLVFES